MFSSISTLQVKVFAWLPFGDQFLWFRETFFANQVVGFKILGAMATKMVATWRVVYNSLLIGVLSDWCISAAKFTAYCRRIQFAFFA